MWVAERVVFGAVVCILVYDSVETNSGANYGGGHPEDPISIKCVSKT